MRRIRRGVMQRGTRNSYDLRTLHFDFPNIDFFLDCSLISRIHHGLEREKLCSRIARGRSHLRRIR